MALERNLRGAAAVRADQIAGADRLHATRYMHGLHFYTKHYPLRVVPCTLDIPKFEERVQWHKYHERDPAILWVRALLAEIAQGFPAAPR